MDNPLPNAILLLLALAARMKAGIINHGVAIGLLQNSQTGFDIDFSAAKAAMKAFGSAEKAKAEAFKAVQTLDDAAYDFELLARNVLAPILGNRWSQAWVDTGFPHQSTGVPKTMDERYQLLDELEDYFTKHPTYEVNTLNLVVTATKAGLLYSQLTAARAAVNDADTAVKQKKIDYAAAVNVLRNRMRGTINELGQKLGPLDPLWRAFGLNQPGADTTPDVPTGLTLQAGSAGMIMATWDFAAGGARYHVWLQIVGVDPAYRNVATVYALTDTLTGQPSGKTANVRITAVNAAGESLPGTPVSIVVP